MKGKFARRILEINQKLEDRLTNNNAQQPIDATGLWKSKYSSTIAFKVISSKSIKKYPIIKEKSRKLGQLSSNLLS